MPEGREIFRFGDFELDEARCELRRSGTPLTIQPTPFRLLQQLIRARDRVLSRDELLDAIWPGVTVSDTALASAIKEVRRALGDTGRDQSWIRTLRGQGVRFVGEVAAVAAPERAREQASAPRARRLESVVATLLFCDLVDSTARIGELGDERARETFESLHARMTAVIEAHAGEELQWLGDGLMAAFGASSDAVRCAIALQRVSRAGGATRLALRVGLNVGELLEAGGDRGYFGTPVIIAARLCDRARAGQILASGVVAGLLAGRRAFRFRDLGALELKGIEAPVAACEVEYDAEEPTTPLAGGTPFVGRGPELARLDRLLEQAESGAGSVVFVTGDAGIGKTRLVDELALRARAFGARVWRGRCFDGEGRRSYGPFAQALDEYAGSAPLPELEADLGPYGAQLVPMAPQLRARLPELLALPALSPDAESERLFYAFVHLVLATAKRAPLVLIADDLHWADAPTIALLRHVGRFARQGRILLVGAYRDVEVERSHPLTAALAALRREAEYERIALAGLEPQAVLDLLSALSQQEVPAAFAERMTETTGGNPFFLREFLAHLVESGTLRRDASGWSSLVPLDEMAVPESVRQVLGRRLARLSEDANRLLRPASAFHGDFPFDPTRSVAELEEGPALDALDEALDAQLVTPLGGDRYRFTHDLIRHALYASINPSRQVRLHRRVAEELARVRGSAAVERAGEIARQYHRSRALPGAERGVESCLIAAEQAERAAAPADTAEMLRMALDLLPDGDLRRPRLLARRACSLAASLDSEEAYRSGSEAAYLLAESEGADAAADYLAELANVLGWGARKLAWRLAEKGLDYIGKRRDVVWAYFANLVQMEREATDPDNPGIPMDAPIRREISAVAGGATLTDRIMNPTDNLAFASREDASNSEWPSSVLYLAGDLRRGLLLYSELVQTALARGELATAAFFLSIVGRIHIALGDLATASQRIEECDRYAARLPNASVVYLNVLGTKADLVFARGEGHELLLPLGDAIVEQRSADQAFGRANVLSYMACGYAHIGDHPRALGFVERALPAIERAPGWAMNYTRIIHLIAETLWVTERAEHVPTMERNLREKTLAPDFRYPSSDARLALARLCALQQRPDEAVEWFAKAREVLDEQGARPLRAIVDLDEATMWLRRDLAGDRQRAAPLLEEALARFEALDMTGWARRARELR